MFNKVKQGKEALKMRGAYKQLQKQLADVTESVEIGNVRVKVSAEDFPSAKVVYIEKDGESLEDVAKAINKATKSLQKQVAMKMVRDGDLDLSSLLGGLS